MNILNKIKENRKSIVILAVLLFNIPLAFGLVSNIEAQKVTDGSYQSIINPPSSQNFFNIQSAATSKATINCDANVGTGIFFDITRGIGTVTVGGDFTTPACLEQTGGTAAVTGYFQGRDTGILNTVSNVQATILEQRPLSTSYYVDQKVYALQNTGVVNAQDRGVAPAPYFPSGTGFQLLSPIQAFWGWSVNIVYGILILIIIGIAFAIVFRNNLGGAQVVTIQSAIPSIALAMILVPLSYAISGIFIDVITVGSNVVHSFLLGPGAPGRAVYEQRNDARTDDCENVTTDDPCDRGLYADDSRVNWFNVQKMVDISDEVKSAVEEIPDPRSPAGSGVALVNNFFIFDAVKRILDLFSGRAESAAYWFGEIINVLIGLTMIWIGLKILWKLFQKYLMLILMPIISPFIFATAAVPGNGTKSIVEYVKMMGSGSLAYIVTYAMFLLTIIFTSSAFQAQIPEIQSGAFVPPLLGLSDIFTQGAGGTPLTHFIFTLVGLGIYFSIPSVLQQIDDALGVKNAIPAFIMTPIDSFRESTNVTFRAAQTGTRGLFRAEQFRRTAGPQVSRFANNAIDRRIRGLKPGDVGTWEFDTKNQLSQQKANAERRKRNQEAVLQNPNATVAEKRSAQGVIAAANREISDIDRSAARYGFEGVGYGKETPEPEIKATVDFQGLPTYSLTLAQYEEQKKIVNAPGFANTGMLLIGGGIKVKFEAIGFTLPGTIALEVYDGQAKPNTAGLTAGNPLVTAGSGGTSPGVGVRVYSSTADNAASENIQNSSLPGSASKVLVASPGRPLPFPDLFTTLETQVKGSYDPRPFEGLRNFELPLNIFIKNPRDFFNNKLTPSNVVETTKVVFKIGENESNPVSILINVKGT